MVVANNEINTTKNAGELVAISMTMGMQRYNGGHIARWSTSRLHLKPLDAWAVSPRWPPWSTISNKTHKTLTKHNF